MSQSAYDEQLVSKQNHLSRILASFDAPDLQVFCSPDKHYRMRAEFRVWHDGDDLYHIMFDPETKKPYRVDQFIPASKVINQAMKAIMDEIRSIDVLRRKLFQIDYLSGLSEELVVSLLYHKPLDDIWQTAALTLQKTLREQFEVSVIGRARKQKMVLDRDHIVEKLPIGGKEYRFMHVENSFTQPNAVVNISMIEWAKQCASQLSGDLLEFYCGAGNFSLPLAEDFRNVVGTEIAKPSVHAAQYSIDANQTNNVKIVRLAAEDFVLALKGDRSYNRLKDLSLSSYDFQTVLVDPPRAGLDDQTLRCVRDFDNIIYISCNPETLSENLQFLCETHVISRAALFDQFPFTHHIESGVLLSRR